MKAIKMFKGTLELQDCPEPRLRSGGLLAKPLVCGICGSDLHARFHTGHLCDLLHRAGFDGFMSADEPVVMGHEFCCEVVEADKQADKSLRVGQRVVALPFVQSEKGVELLGYSNSHYGAFSELMLLQADLAFSVPDHVPTEVAALTEPLSVAVHAVNAAQPDSETACAVVGCGPVGLFVISRLKHLGMGPVLAIEPNATRAKAAEKMGADRVLSSAGDASANWWQEQGLPLGLSDSMAVSDGGRKRSRAVVFDCVGKPGITMNIAENCPVGAKIVVVGTCMEPDQIEPAFLLQKGLTLQYVFAYSPEEFKAAFEMICESPSALKPMITRQVGFAEIESAFDALGNAGEDLKVLVNPAL